MGTPFPIVLRRYIHAPYFSMQAIEKMRLPPGSRQPKMCPLVTSGPELKLSPRDVASEVPFGLRPANGAFERGNQGRIEEGFSLRRRPSDSKLSCWWVTRLRDFFRFHCSLTKHRSHRGCNSISGGICNSRIARTGVGDREFCDTPRRMGFWTGFLPGDAPKSRLGLRREFGRKFVLCIAVLLGDYELRRYREWRYR